jgi:hypothetical protein
MIPAADVFQRILTDLPPTATVGDVDGALQHLCLFNTSDNDAMLERPPSPTRATPGPLDGSFDDLYQRACLAHTVDNVPASGEPAVEPGTGNGTTAATNAREMNELQRLDGTTTPVGLALINYLFVAATPPLLNNDDIPQKDKAPTGDAPTPPAPALPPN